MNRELFNQNIIAILNEGNIENQQLEHIDILENLFSDKSLKSNLYKKFTENLMSINESDDFFLKTQDMIYRIHYVIKNYLIKELGIIDKQKIKNIINDLIINDMDFYSAVSYDDLDKEIVLDAEFIYNDLTKDYETRI